MSHVTSSSIVVRLASPSDAALLAELGERTFVETFAPENNPADITEYVALSFGVSIQRVELADPDSTFFVAEVEGRAMGYAKLCAGSSAGSVPSHVTGPRQVELARLYVLRQWYGRGVGVALMDRSVEEARAAGYRTMWLGVWEHNLRAQAFYRKHGFRVVGEHTFRLGADAQLDLLMERPL